MEDVILLQWYGSSGDGKTHLLIVAGVAHVSKLAWVE